MPWLEKGVRIEGDHRRQFEPERPSPSFISNKQMLDSVWVNDWKNIYTYDTNSNMTVWLSQRGENNGWIYYHSTTYSYDINGYLVEEIGAGSIRDGYETYRKTYINDIIWKLNRRDISNFGRIRGGQ